MRFQEPCHSAEPQGRVYNGRQSTLADAAYLLMLLNFLGPPSSRRRFIGVSLAVLIVAVLPLLYVACGAEPTATATMPPATAAPAPTATSTPEPTPTTAPLVSLPEDEAPHATPVEWWYFNGMLRDDAGGEYSYHFVTFQSPGPPGVTPHLLQATLGDHGQGVHYTAEKAFLAQENPDARGVDVATGVWLMRGGGDGYEMRLRFARDGPALELTAIPQREPVLHGGTGLVQMGPEAGSTYYYSRTRLEVTGWIEEAGERRQVRGPGWMDHQWGEFVGGRVGWDWTSIQLDDGADLMAVVIWHPDGHRRLSAHGTYAAPGGEVTYLEGDELSIASLGSWTSPETGIQYPMGWRVEIPSLELGLELAPYLEHSEYDSSILNAAYWEGAAAVSGQRGGQAVAGWGFVELVGYDPRQAEVTLPTPSPQR